MSERNIRKHDPKFCPLCSDYEDMDDPKVLSTSWWDVYYRPLGKRRKNREFCEGTQKQKEAIGRI